MRRVQAWGVIVLRSILAEYPPNNLLDLDRGTHALVDVCKIAGRVIPTFLQCLVEDNVAVVSRSEVIEVALLLREELELIRLVSFGKLQVCVDGNRFRVDLLIFDKIAPNSDRRSLSKLKHLRVVIPLPIDHVRIANIDCLGQEPQFPQRYFLLNGLHAINQAIQRLLHVCRRAIKLDSSLNELSFDHCFAANSCRYEVRIRGPCFVIDRFQFRLRFLIALAGGLKPKLDVPENITLECLRELQSC